MRGQSGLKLLTKDENDIKMESIRHELVLQRIWIKLFTNDENVIKDENIRHEKIRHEIVLQRNWLSNTKRGFLRFGQ